jgi:hypothetical protein
MFRRMMLALTFVAALGVAGLGMSKTADAWGGCHRGGYYGGYGGYDGGYGAYYAPYGYRTSYFPRYGAYYDGYYGYYPRYHRHGGVSFSVGF